MSIHIGKHIQEEVRRQGRTVTWLAQAYGCSRVNMYKVFEKPSVDTGTLLRLSAILDYDFFSLYSNELSRKQNHSTL